MTLAYLKKNRRRGRTQMRRKMRKSLKWNKKIEQQGSKIDRLPSGEKNSDIKLNCFCVYDVCLSTVKICI